MVGKGSLCDEAEIGEVAKQPDELCSYYVSTLEYLINSSIKLGVLVVSKDF
jgi:hypothetical protein